jgi:hypothetical protein
MVLGKGLYVHHTGTFHAASGNADVLEQAFAPRNFGKLYTRYSLESGASSQLGRHTLIIVYLHNPVKKHYNEIMRVAIKRYAPLCILVPALLGFVTCAGIPSAGKPQFTLRHYAYSVLLTPENPGKSPQLELAMSLLRMEYPAERTQSFHNILYGQTNPDEYRYWVFSEQRRNYRDRAGYPAAEGDGIAAFNWRYVERFSVKQTYDRGMVIERDLETYFGGAHPGRNTQYYNVEVETNEYKLLSLDDLFDNFQENQQLRDIIYEELRKYDGLDNAQPLSQGIYYNNKPELTFNFFVTEDGLGLHWDSAQIAPHVHGSIQIILPWHDIQPLMLHTGVEMLAKFNIHRE